jgi:hypothetical protein
MNSHANGMAPLARRYRLSDWDSTQRWVRPLTADAPCARCVRPRPLGNPSASRWHRSRSGRGDATAPRPPHHLRHTACVQRQDRTTAWRSHDQHGRGRERCSSGTPANSGKTFYKIAKAELLLDTTSSHRCRYSRDAKQRLNLINDIIANHTDNVSHGVCAWWLSKDMR